MKHDSKYLMKRAVTWLCSMFLACAIALTGYVMGATAQAPLALAEAIASDPSPATYVYQRNANSVVGVIVNAQSWNRSTGEVNEKVSSEGSGVVIAEGGYVLTNEHVIEDGGSYQILLPSGEKVGATLTGSDPSLDLAVLQVEEPYREALVPVTIGSSNELDVGSTVVAIGNPGGEVLANTVTQGIVSALERSAISGSNTSRNVDYIQHDAPINSGNSGGGLFNYRGELVGINTLKYSGAASVSIEGLGFAIPIDTAYPIAQQLIEHGEVTRPQLGISVSDQDGPDEPISSYPPKSVCVRSVDPDSPAEAAGLQQYDFIYAVNGERVTSTRELTTALDRYQAGDSVELTVVRYDSVHFQSEGDVFGRRQRQARPNDDSNTVTVGGSYRFVTISVTLELPKNADAQ